MSGKQARVIKDRSFVCASTREITFATGGNIFRGLVCVK